jgi:S-adenosylmethionine:tRNA ribosyltransferase-isomerase
VDRRSDYDFDLPEELIAQRPAQRRDESRILGVFEDLLVDGRFPDLVGWLPEGAVVVVNDTRVLKARVAARKAESGGAVELLFLEPVGGELWRCMARASKPIRAGAALLVGEQRVEVEEGRDQEGCIVVRVPGDAMAFLDSHGHLPLPPYVTRPATTEDDERYQTLFARVPGAVAAPTAGLHFTEEILARLSARGIERTSITLHVGMGTFSPVRCDNLDDHRMHEERYEIPAATAELVNSGRPVVAVGTTVVRALESAAAEHGAVRAGASSSALFIRPGYRFRVVDHLVTNFHLPESTLLMLVSAFAGYERIRAAYRHALEERYRFFSYGDAMYLSRQGSGYGD